MMTKPFDVSAVGYVKRVVIGNTDPEKTVNEEDIEKQRQLLNRCLSDSPRGRIIGQEKNFYLLNIGEHQVVMQYIVYHVGFARRRYGWKIKKAACYGRLFSKEGK
jgi:hypothetical protein